MKHDYLWDGSGKPDPEIERLENVLGRFRHRGAASEFPESQLPEPHFPEMVPKPSVHRARRRWFWRVAALATAAAIVGVVWILLRPPRPATTPQAGWEVARVAGTPRVGTRLLGEATGTGKLAVGQSRLEDSLHPQICDIAAQPRRAAIRRARSDR